MPNLLPLCSAGEVDFLRPISQGFDTVHRILLLSPTFAIGGNAPVRRHENEAPGNRFPVFNVNEIEWLLIYQPKRVVWIAGHWH